MAKNCIHNLLEKMALTSEHFIEIALNADDICANSEGQSSGDTDAKIIETAPDKSDDTGEHLENRSSDEPNRSGDLPSPRKRKRKKNAAESKRQKNKRLRERGQTVGCTNKMLNSPLGNSALDVHPSFASSRQNVHVVR